jgi:magnesium transporter
MPTTILTHGRVTWTNIVCPTPEDLAELSKRYPQFHPVNIQDCLTELEYPKLDQHDDYLFLVVQIPVYDSLLNIPRPGEVDIFISHGILVTSHHGELKTLENIFCAAQKDDPAREGLMGKGASPLLYHLISTLVDDCFPAVQEVSRNLRSIEERMFNDDNRGLLLELAMIRREVISLKGVIDLQPAQIQALEAGSWTFIHEELDLYWSDLANHMLQLKAMLAEYSEVIDGLSDTIDTLASHRIDDVVRLLTIVTVITLPLTLLATIFGMNIMMPFSEHWALFYILLIVGLGLTAYLIWYLRKRRWL